ncbi:MAG: hypothetical protein KAW17_10945, partial [Candidatus Eisenbacteria sp.]|nr:hypothetical protein [Candidatus Eisenbacteria bacterium]
GVGAEERGQAEAIARSIDACLDLRVPIISVVIGEGGSGGAIALAAADRVMMLEHAVYSVISPEGCAAILWTDRSKAPRAAEAMRMTAQDLRDLGVIDGIIPEPVGGAHRDPRGAALRVREAVLSNLARLDRIPTDELIERRVEKYWAMGVFEEEGKPEGEDRGSVENGDARGEMEIG